LEKNEFVLVSAGMELIFTGKPGGDTAGWLTQTGYSVPYDVTLGA